MLVGWNATTEELEKIDSLQKALSRRTRADLLRVLVADAFQKIFTPVIQFGNTNANSIPAPAPVARAVGEKQEK